MTPRPPHLLLLAGSGEARLIADALSDRTDLKVTGSLLYPERSAGPLSVPVRLGPFGGAEAFRKFLRDAHITSVLDATHPFAHRISTRTAAICTEMELPYARMLRPPWTAAPGDNWREVSSEAEACEYVQPGERVFTTTGRSTLAGFGSFPGACLFVRQIRPGPAPPEMPFVHLEPGEGPFSTEDEIATFKRLRIDRLIVKNSGGVPSRTKLDAARHLKLPVLLIARPPQLDAHHVSTVQEALNWTRTL